MLFVRYLQCANMMLTQISTRRCYRSVICNVLTWCSPNLVQKMLYLRCLQCANTILTQISTRRCYTSDICNVQTWCSPNLAQGDAICKISVMCKHDAHPERAVFVFASTYSISSITWKIERSISDWGQVNSINKYIFNRENRLGTLEKPI